MLALNLLCDHRISKARWQKFLTAAKFEDASQLSTAVSDYYWKNVVPKRLARSRRTALRAFERQENRRNEVHLSPDTELGTVVNLTRLGRVLQDARRPFRIPQFERVAVRDEFNTDIVNRVLLDYLGSDSRKRDFLESLLRAARLYNRRAEPTLRCTWAARWDTLSGFLVKDTPQRWLQAVGVSIEDPAWIAVFRYSVSDLIKRGIRLFRPTQLDAGWNANHFPSPPPPAKRQAGGHTMFLGLSNNDPTGFGLVNEYLHSYIDFDIQHWEAAGSLVEPVQPARGKLMEQRAAHQALLVKHYGPEVIQWLSD